MGRNSGNAAVTALADQAVSCLIDIICVVGESHYDKLFTLAFNNSSPIQGGIGAIIRKINLMDGMRASTQKRNQK